MENYETVKANVVCVSAWIIKILRPKTVNILIYN